MSGYLTVTQAAETLGMDPGSVRRAIIQGRLLATKFGHAWQIHPADIVAYRQRPKRSKGGRPRKVKEQAE